MQLSAPRLLCALSALALTTCSAPSGRMRASHRHYTDRTAMVDAPRVDAEVSFDDGLVRLSPYWTVDVISAASPRMAAPDVVSRATTFAETRHEAGASLALAPSSELELGARYTASVENDYVSHTAGLSAGVDLFDKRSTLDLALRAGFDTIGRSDVASFERELLVLGADLGWTEVLGPHLLLAVTLALEVRDGFQVNPYRLVPIYEPDAPRPTYALPEAAPSLRVRGALDGSLAWYLGHELYLHGGYRAYLDDWGVTSHALTAELWSTFLDDVLRLRLRTRGYTQTAADFFRTRYEHVGAARSGDYRLSAMSTLSGGARLDLRTGVWTAPWPLTLGAGYDATWFLLPDYAVFDAMVGHSAQVFLELETP